MKQNIMKFYLLFTVMVSVFMLSAVVLSAVMHSVVIQSTYPECSYTECYYVSVGMLWPVLQTYHDRQWMILISDACTINIIYERKYL